jgi:hypothetical protein
MTARKLTSLVLGLILVALLAGCPGMPGAAGGRGAENTPPGLLPPPGMTSGGARTLMGATITPPENSFLLVKYVYSEAPAESAAWLSCRRVIPLDNSIIVEGLNYDGRNEALEKDVNQLLPFLGLVSFYWKYEPKPAPPPKPEGQGKPQGR